MFCQRGKSFLPERFRNDTATTTPAAFRMQAKALGLWGSKVTVHGVTGERLLQSLITNSSGFPTVCSEPCLFEDNRQVNNPVEEPEGRLWHSCYMDDQTDNYTASPLCPCLSASPGRFASFPLHFQSIFDHRLPLTEPNVSPYNTTQVSVFSLRPLQARRLV